MVDQPLPSVDGASRYAAPPCVAERWPRNMCTCQCRVGGGRSRLQGESGRRDVRVAYRDRAGMDGWPDRAHGPGQGGDADPPRNACDDSFFFQAEDGIRDLTVTGVQTCALPI